MTRSEIDSFCHVARQNTTPDNGPMVATLYKDVLELEPILEVYLIAVLCDEIDRINNENSNLKMALLVDNPRSVG